MVWVIQARYLEGYKIWLCFSDGLEGTIDLEKTILEDSRPIFQALRDLEQFQQFQVDMDTVVWANGLDLAPEYLHDLLKNSLVGR